MKSASSQLDKSSKPSEVGSKVQQRIGARCAAVGQLLLALLLLVCFLDVGWSTTKETVSFPLYGYLACIFVGVAMQFVGAAIPNMRFANSKAAR